MAELPHVWSVYACLQEKLALRRQVDDQAWGLEAGLNRLLANPEAITTEEDVDLAVRSESRKERYRVELRRARIGLEGSDGNLEDALDARRRLRLIKAQVSPEQWALLRELGEGREYNEIAANLKVAPGTLRARVLRLRRILVAGKGGKMKLPRPAQVLKLAG